MMSHELPDPVFSLLQRLISGVEEGLQAEAHKVGSAIAEHPAFDASWVESHLTRAVVSSLAQSRSGKGLRFEGYGNGGAEVVNLHDGIERRFRFRKARRGPRRELVVTVSSDSYLTMKALDPSLFDDETTRNAPPPTLEQWVIAYVLRPGTLTFDEVSAARAVDIEGNSPPFRLKLANITPIPYDAPPPPDFKPSVDDLDLGEEDKREEKG